jgi:hypothetical protein
MNAADEKRIADMMAKTLAMKRAFLYKDIIIY